MRGAAKSSKTIYVVYRTGNQSNSGEETIRKILNDFTIGELIKEDADDLRTLIRDYTNCFAIATVDPGCTTATKMSIELTNDGVKYRRLLLTLP